MRHPRACSSFDKNESIQCLRPAVAKDLDASSGTTEAEEHPNQTGFPEPWCPTMSQLAGSWWNQPFCTQEQGNDCCPVKLHRMQHVLAFCI